MPGEDYKKRTIHDISGRELDEDTKEKYYVLGKALIEELIAKDKSSQELNAYLKYNKSYTDTNFEIKPVSHWTTTEVLNRIKAAKKESSIGSVGWFEAADRVRNFKSRMTLSDTLSKELGKVNKTRIDALVDISIGTAASLDKAVEVKDESLNKIAVNWIPYLKRLKEKMGSDYTENYKSLEPHNVFRNLSEDTRDTLPNLLDMLQIVEDTDMEEFAYTDNASFAANFAVKYEKLKALADGTAMIEHIRSKNEGKFLSKRELTQGNADSSKVCEAKCRLAGELLKDYEIRMRLITSPYYALIAGKDIEKISVSKLQRLKKKEGHEALNAYLDNVIEYKNNRVNSLKGVDLTGRVSAYVTDIKPAPVPEVKLPSEVVLENMDKLIRTMYLDTKRASAYKKVRKVLKKYIEADNEEDKASYLLDAVGAANTYLKDRKQSSYGYRKERCEQLIALAERYDSELADEKKMALEKAAALEDAQNKDRLDQQTIRTAREKELSNIAGDLADAAAKKRQAEFERQEAERKRIEAEKQKELERQEAERKRIEQLERERQEAERLNQLEKLRQLEEEKKAAEEKLRKEAEEREKKEAERKEAERKALEAKLAKEREHRIFLESIDNAVKKYDELNTLGKTYKNSEEARKTVLAFYDKYIFKKDKKLDDDLTREDFNTIPTSMLVDALKAHMLDTDKDNYADIIKADVSKRLWDNAPTHEEFRRPLINISNKSAGDITELDRLMLFEYSVHLLAYVGQAEVNFDTTILKNIKLEKLSALAVHMVNLDESYIEEKKGETFDNIPSKQREIHIKEAAEILALLSGKSADVYKFLPVEVISRYAFDAVEKMADASGQKKLLNTCYKEASIIKERHDLLLGALESGNKDKLIDSIAKVTGKNQDDIDVVPTDDIINLAKAMFEKVIHFEDMINIYNDLKKVFIDRNEDYYREKYLELETKNRVEGKLSPAMVQLKKEYSYAYVKKSLGLDKETAGIVDTLDDETLYKLVSDIGVIKYLNQTAASIEAGNKGIVNVREVLSNLNDDEYVSIGMNVTDYDKAVKDITSLNINKALSDGINRILKMEYPIEKVDEELQYDEEGNTVNDEIDIEYADKVASDTVSMFNIYNDYNSGKYDSGKNNTKNDSAKDAKTDSVIDTGKVTNAEAKKQENKNRWSKEARELLEIISDLYLVATKKPVDAKMITDTVKARHSSFVAFMNGGENNPYHELLDGLSEQEKVFVEGAKKVLDDINKYCRRINKEHPEYGRSLQTILDKHEIDINWEEAYGSLNEAVVIGEKGIVKLMREATDDCFDVVGGMGIPDILNADNNIDNDKDALNFAQNRLKYDSASGQGKFLQTLMNDYYSEADLKDRRLMLSFIIKDFKKKNPDITEKQKGGEYFASSLKGAGPLMQKMMQGVPEYIVVPELRNAMNIVKSDLRPIDMGYVNGVVQKIVEKSKKKITSIDIENSLGAASIAQTFSCTVTTKKCEEKDAVIKILRPDAKERMNRELSFIRKSAWFADLSNREVQKYKEAVKGKKLPSHTTTATEAGFLAQLSEIEKEFDLKNEAENCKTGVDKYGKKNKNVKTVELIDVPAGENYLLMSKAEGMTLDRYIKGAREVLDEYMSPFRSKDGKYQNTYKLTTDNIMKVKEAFETLNNVMLNTLDRSDYVTDVAGVWTEEALYGSAWSLFSDYNFRHGDLHAGNIMVDSDGATILDYGNATMLHYDKVTIILQMMSSVIAKRPDLFVEAFQEFLRAAQKDDAKSEHPIGYEEMSPKVKALYIKKLKDIFNTGPAENAGIKILLSLSTAQSIGIKLPMEMQNFSQCQQRLENSMSDIKNAAIEIRKGLDKLERMSLDRSIENSSDPDVVFHRAMLEKDEEGNYKYHDSEEAAKALVEMFNPAEGEQIIAGASALIDGTAEIDIDDFLKDHYPPYRNLITAVIGEEKVTIDTFPGIIKEWKNIYNKAKEEYNSKGNISEETRKSIKIISDFIEAQSQENGLLCRFETKDTVSDFNNKAFNPPFDDLAFKKLMSVCEVDIGSISSQCRMIHNIPNTPDIFDEREGQILLAAVLYPVYKTIKPVCEFADKLNEAFKAGDTKAESNNSKIDAFENEMRRTFWKDDNFKVDYDDYKKARIAFNELTLKNGSEEFVKARERLVVAENDLLRSYYTVCTNVFKEIAENRKDVCDMDYVLRKYDYVDVIYNVIQKNKVSTLKRVGFEIKNAVEAQMKIEEEEYKAQNTINEHKAEKKDTEKTDTATAAKENEKANEKHTDKELEKNKSVFVYAPKADFELKKKDKADKQMDNKPDNKAGKRADNKSDNKAAKKVDVKSDNKTGKPEKKKTGKTTDKNVKAGIKKK